MNDLIRETAETLCERVDWNRPELGVSSCAEAYPLAGVYDSDDPATVRRHIRLAKAAGIDGFLVDWWGPGIHAAGRVGRGANSAGLHRSSGPPPTHEDLIGHGDRRRS